MVPNHLPRLLHAAFPSYITRHDFAPVTYAGELELSRTDATHDFEKLIAFLEKLPAIDLPAGRKSSTLLPE